MSLTLQKPVLSPRRTSAGLSFRRVLLPLPFAGDPTVPFVAGAELITAQHPKGRWEDFRFDARTGLLTFGLRFFPRASAQRFSATFAAAMAGRAAKPLTPPRFFCDAEFEGRTTDARLFDLASPFTPARAVLLSGSGDQNFSNGTFRGQFRFGADNAFTGPLLIEGFAKFGVAFRPGSLQVFRRL